MCIISAADDAVHANDEMLATASAMPINLKATMLTFLNHLVNVSSAHA
jgi:hypothetical protein